MNTQDTGNMGNFPYLPGKICCHIFHIKLYKVQEHILYLSMADNWNERKDMKRKKNCT